MLRITFTNGPTRPRIRPQRNPTPRLKLSHSQHQHPPVPVPHTCRPTWRDVTSSWTITTSASPPKLHCSSWLITFKGTVHPKMKNLSSFSHPQVVPNPEFLSSAEHTKEDILKNVGNQTTKPSMVWKSMATINSLMAEFLFLGELCL